MNPASHVSLARLNSKRAKRRREIRTQTFKVALLAFSARDRWRAGRIEIGLDL